MNGAKTRYSQYGKEIKRKLIEKDMSQKELAARVGIHPKRISDIIRGTFPGLKYREKISEVLDIPIIENDLKPATNE
ncbi:MAG: helix-turn-helix domain-containing protein [Defluviitaleaceae bacterium]|nr:helix-turn-helix domain-containing protein [Defluviitaleaceae bacterium]MCL2836691.1 helix-turn-helix domain-containing protein [Defluviitaleaceae bacterium]